MEQRFLSTWGITRKIGKIIEKQINESEVENNIEKIAENIDMSEIDGELLLDLIQKQHINGAILTALVRRKMYSQEVFT
ncbi:hypothetical protein LCGC14_0934510 [marine sediment metagenome]|uniref:Uncharacterized protein n=1 Tax=marine sediment metagenome TaxID=412755 RepID=A0A0F9P826_9ZZZZ|nr:hypothetical protein [archaeon]